MPYKYIGRTTDFKGKTLWEIVGNLKNYGVGRVVIRSRFERYPEPTYLKILKVEPLPSPEVQSLDNQRKVRVLVEKTFRGTTSPKPMTIESASYKTDYRLLHRDEEESYCRKIETKPAIVLPRTMDMPSLLKEMVLREKRAKGEDTSEALKVEIIYRNSNNPKYRIANDGEQATLMYGIDSPKLPNISLYKNVKVFTQ